MLYLSDDASVLGKDKALWGINASKVHTQDYFIHISCQRRTAGSRCLALFTGRRGPVASRGLLRKRMAKRPGALFRIRLKKQ